MEASPTRRFFWLGLSLVALTFLVSAIFTWRKWPDLIVDFGGQLYIPWRLSEGAVLYRDLYYFAGGPFSQYFNAALFKVFGVSFLTLIFANLAITTALLWLVYFYFRKATDTMTATVMALSVVVVFACAQLVGISNYNFITPYSHEMTHGIVLSILAVIFMSNWLVSRKLWPILVAGFCAGLVLLTKPDIFLAVATVAALAFGLFLHRRGWTFFWFRSLGGFLFAIVIPSVAFFLWFLKNLDWRESLQSVFFGWRPLFAGHVAKDPYYQWSLGFDDPFAHLAQMLSQFLVLAAIVAIYSWIFRRLEKAAVLPRRILTVLALVLLLIGANHFDWMSCGSALPILSVIACILLRRQMEKTPEEIAVVFPLLWAVFGLVLFAKQGIFPRIWQTGFGLAMPGFMTAVYLMLWLLPKLLAARFGIPASPMRLAVALTICVAMFQLAARSEKFYSAKNFPIGQGKDRILANGPSGYAAEAKNMSLALDWIQTNVPPQATLAALPQGVMLNFLSRRASSSPCLDWNPTMMQVFGKETMTAGLTNHPPDFIAVVEWKPFDFGVNYFGKESGYGDDVMAWVYANYEPVALFGGEPLQKGLFGIKFLKRITPSGLPQSN